MIYLLLIVVGLDLGVYRFPDNWKLMIDLLNIFLLIYSIPNYIKARKSINIRSFRMLEFFWVVFIIYLSVLLMNEGPYLSKISSLFNLRQIYSYLLFFFIISILKNESNYKIFWSFCIYFAIIGVILSIGQSIYGSTPIFDNRKFYNTGHTGGNTSDIGAITRVILPTLYLIEVIFLHYFIVNLRTFKIKNILMMIILIVPVIIGYARGQWLAIAICMLLVFMIHKIFIKQTLIFTMNRLTGLIISTFFILLFSYIVSSIVNPEFLRGVNERIYSLYYDIAMQEGTFGSRLQTIDFGIKLWQDSPFFGQGPFFSQKMELPQLTDVGFLYVLVTIGVAGLIIFILLLLSNIIFGYHLLKHELKHKSNNIDQLGILVIVIPIYLMIAQQFTQFYFSFSVLPVISGYAIARARIFTK